MPPPGKTRKPAAKVPAQKTGDPREALYQERWTIHEKCSQNYPGSECYIANQTECTQYRLLHELQARCPGQPSRWGAAPQSDPHK